MYAFHTDLSRTISGVFFHAGKLLPAMGNSGGKAPPAWAGASRLDDLLRRGGWTSTRLATVLRVSQATVSRYRSGERAPDPDRLVDICRATGLSADEILGLPLNSESASHEAARLRAAFAREAAARAER